MNAVTKTNQGAVTAEQVLIRGDLSSLGETERAVFFEQEQARQRRLGRRLTADEAREIAEMVIRQAKLAVAIKKGGW